ncbi:hypothetical protein ACLKA7_012708 [Drosophila subpalustris]
MARLTLIVFSLVCLGSSYFNVVVALPLTDSIPAELPIDWPSLSGRGVTADAQPGLYDSLRGVNIEDYAEAKESPKRRKRQVPGAEKNHAVENRPLLNPPIDGSMATHEKTFSELQDEIFDNLGIVAHDVASELSMHLGLRPHTLEAVLTHEEDAPSFPEVLETMAKRFHAPKILLAGLHTLIERRDYFEDYYELDDEEKSLVNSPANKQT